MAVAIGPTIFGRVSGSITLHSGTIYCSTIVCVCWEILLRDVEELWEPRLQDAVRTYEYALRLERCFVDRCNYIRFVGNHDDRLISDFVFQYLSPSVAGEKPIDSLTVEVTE